LISAPPPSLALTLFAPSCTNESSRHPERSEGSAFYDPALPQRFPIANPLLAVIQRSAFRDEGSLFDVHFLPEHPSANSALVVVLLALTQRRERSEGSAFYAEGSPSLTKKISTSTAFRQGTASALPKNALRPTSFRVPSARAFVIHITLRPQSHHRPSVFLHAGTHSTIRKFPL
jgi:hypothetical protein